MPRGHEWHLVQWTSTTLAAATVARGRRGLRVIASVVEPVPDGVDHNDASALGRWIGETLTRRGVTGKRLIVVAPRAALTLQRLALPDQLTDEDLPAFAKLQLRRQGVVDPEGAAIAVRTLSNEVAGESMALAAAMPAEALSHIRDTVAAAGRTLAQVRLRAEGLAALRPQPGLSLIAYAGPQTLELVVCDEGEAVFAREAEINAEAPRAKAIAVEIRRTQMAARAIGLDLSSAPVHTLDAAFDDVATPEAVSKAFGAAIEPLPVSEPLEDAPELDSALAPLIGAVLSMERGALDLVAVPQVSQSHQRRRTAMLAIAAVVVLGGGAWVVAQQRLDALRDIARDRRGAESELRDRYIDMLAIDARAESLEAWIDVEPDWTSHVRWLNERLPSRDRLRLDEIRATVEGGSRFTPEKKGVYTGGVWAPSRSVSLTLSGQVDQRDAALNLRAAILDSGVFRLEPRGADEPDRFSWRLFTSSAAPVDNES